MPQTHARELAVAGVLCAHAHTRQPIAAHLTFGGARYGQLEALQERVAQLGIPV